MQAQEQEMAKMLRSVLLRHRTGRPLPHRSPLLLNQALQSGLKHAS